MTSALDNFRTVYPFPDDKKRGGSCPGVIFRSAKVNVKEYCVVEEVKKHNILTVIDFSVSDLEKNCIETIQSVDNPVFTTRRVRLISKERYSPGEDFVSEDVEIGTDRRRSVFSINVLSSFQLVKTAFGRVPWYYTVAGLFLVLIDLLLWTTHYKHFVSLCFHIEEMKGGLVQLYKDILDMGHKGVCVALKILSDQRNHPVVISCAAGKDRTGLVTALVLHCLGCSKDYIAQEYSLSQKGVDNMSENAVFKKVCKIVNFPKSFQTAKAETMLETLQYLENRYGSIDDYLEYIGFTRADQEKLRASVTGH